MARIDERSGSYRVEWDLPSSMWPAGKRNAKGRLTLKDLNEALDAKEIAELHSHAITSDAVKEQLAKKRIELSGGTTFGEWAEKFFVYKEKNHAWDDGKTRYENMRRFREEILPAFGQRPIATISATDIHDFLHALKKRRPGRSGKGLSHTTVNHYCDNITQVITHAFVRGGVPANPLVDDPWNRKKPRSEIDNEIDREAERYFEINEFEQIFNNLRDDMRPFVRLLLETGMRFNEASALMIEDIEPRFNLVRIRQAWPGNHPGQKTEDLEPGPTKNRGWRSAYISDDLLAGLIPLIDKRRTATDTIFDKVKITAHTKPELLQQLVFQGAQGGIVKNPNFRRDHWNIAMNRIMQCSVHMPTRIDKRNGREVVDLRLRSTCACIPEPPWIKFSPHSLRHTCASWLIFLGEPIQNVSMLLGHSSVAVTQGVYVHQLHRSRHLSLDQGLVTRMREFMPNCPNTQT